MAAVAHEVWTIHTEVFDGPLDLLLHLVKKEGVALRKISIARIADAYLDYLDRMRELHLGIAGDYLVLAATLCHLKSLELLPRPPTQATVEQDPVDPREAFVQRLVDYQRYREAADAIEERDWLGRDVFSREPSDLGNVPKPLVSGIDAFGLLDLYHHLLRRQAEPEAVHEVHQSGYDIGSCCRHVLKVLGGPGGECELSELLVGLRTRAERVVTFLSVLEMARLRWVEIVQSEHLGAVTVTSRVAVDVDLQPVVGRIEVAAG